MPIILIYTVVAMAVTTTFKETARFTMQRTQKLLLYGTAAAVYRAMAATHSIRYALTITQSALNAALLRTAQIKI